MMELERLRAHLAALRIYLDPEVADKVRLLQAQRAALDAEEMLLLRQALQAYEQRRSRLHTQP